MKSLDKQDWEKRFEKEIWHINHKSGLDKFPNRGCNCEMEDDCKKSLKSFIQSELDRQREEYSDIVDNGFDKDFGTYDYKQIASEFINKIKSLKSK